MKKPRVTMLPGGREYRHEIDAWSGVFPVSSLPGWIKFYRRMATKRPRVYGPSYTALKLFQAQHGGAQK